MLCEVHSGIEAIFLLVHKVTAAEELRTAEIGMEEYESTLDGLQISAVHYQLKWRSYHLMLHLNQKRL